MASFNKMTLKFIHTKAIILCSDRCGHCSLVAGRAVPSHLWQFSFHQIKQPYWMDNSKLSKTHKDRGQMILHHVRRAYQAISSSVAVISLLLLSLPQEDHPAHACWHRPHSRSEAGGVMVLCWACSFPSDDPVVVPSTCCCDHLPGDNAHVLHHADFRRTAQRHARRLITEQCHGLGQVVSMVDISFVVRAVNATVYGS